MTVRELRRALDDEEDEAEVRVGTSSGAYVVTGIEWLDLGRNNESMILWLSSTRPPLTETKSLRIPREA